MDRPSLAVRDVPALGPGGKRFLLDCRHGSTSAVVFPGRATLGELAVLDLLMIRHGRDNGCSCAREIRPALLGVAHA